MNVSLTPVLEALVKEKVDSGLYNSASEVIRAALRLLSEQEHIREIRLNELRSDINKGLNSGEARPANFDELKTRGRKKLKQQK